MDDQLQENLKRSEVTLLEKQANATLKVGTSINNLSDRIESLEKAFDKSANSSSRLSLSLNFLTACLVVVGILQIFFN